MTKPLNTAGLMGPADTVDASVVLSTTTPRPASTRLAGTASGAAPVPSPPPVKRNTAADRFEIYETAAPDGRPMWMRRNLETGFTEAVSVEVWQQDRDGRAQRAVSDAVEAARRDAVAAEAVADRAARAAQRAAAEAQKLAATAGKQVGA